MPIGGGDGFASSFPSSTFPATGASSGMPLLLRQNEPLYACRLSQCVHFWMRLYQVEWPGALYAPKPE